ncbi:MAG: DMT family transporter [Alphaproteobacteria bacterium]|nr:DMT family transporter [Alphaproteobacteria bacterium]
MSKDTLCGILALILFCWGSVLVVLCLQVLPPFELGAAIFFIGYIMLTLLQLARGKNVITPWKQAPVIYMGAVSGIGIYTVLIYAAFKMEPAFEVNVLNYLWPIFMVVFFDGFAKISPEYVAYCRGCDGVHRYGVIIQRPRTEFNPRRYQFGSWIGRDGRCDLGGLLYLGQGTELY